MIELAVAGFLIVFGVIFACVFYDKHKMESEIKEMRANLERTKERQKYLPEEEGEEDISEETNEERGIPSSAVMDDEDIEDE